MCKQIMFLGMLVGSTQAFVFGLLLIEKKIAGNFFLQLNSELI